MSIPPSEVSRILFKLVGAVAFTAAVAHFGGWWWVMFAWGFIVWSPDQWYFRR